MKTTLAALTILALPLVAQDHPISQPGFVQLNLSAPVHGLKDQVGNRTGMGGSLGYIFYATPKQDASIALRLESDDFSNSSTRREAHGVGIGGEFTVYFQSGLRGAYLSATPSLYIWSLTDRNNGVLTNQQYVRGGGTIALGYRFAKRFSLEANWKSATVDQDLQLSSFGVGVKLHF